MKQEMMGYNFSTYTFSALTLFDLAAGRVTAL